MEGHALLASGVRKRFGSVDALTGLDLDVQRGETVGLLGPNGSGKTTFIRCVAGLVRPDAGAIAVLGLAPREAAHSGLVGYMTQTPALYPELTVEENLAFFAARLALPTHLHERGAALGDGEGSGPGRSARAPRHRRAARLRSRRGRRRDGDHPQGGRLAALRKVPERLFGRR